MSTSDADVFVHAVDGRRVLRVGWFGTSIMEHLEGYNAQLTTQANLPEIGAKITVEGWRRRGYVHRLHLALQVAWPHVTFDFDNRAEGGAPSRDISGIVRQATDDDPGYDLVFLGCVVSPYLQRRIGRTALLWSLVV